MRRAKWVAMALPAVLLVIGHGAAAAPEESAWIIHLQGPPGVAQEAVGRAVLRAGGVVRHVYGLIPAMAVELPLPALNALTRNPNVRALIAKVEVDAVRSIPQPMGPPPWANGRKPPPPPPAQTLEWGVDRIDAERAWDTSRGLGVKVAVIDTGIDKDHPDLAENLKGGVNFVVEKGKLNPDNWDDPHGHGTHVAGIIAAADNTVGVVGVAPLASLYAVRVFNKSGFARTSDIIKGIEWAVANGMQVVNMSFGASQPVDAERDACAAAEAAGLVLVAAAGNEGDGDPNTTELSYPAAYDSVIAVAATDNTDKVAAWSNSGEFVELAAPGVSIRSTYKGGGYATMSGTSMASPHVAGTAALVLGAILADNPPPGADGDSDGVITLAELRAWLAATADDLPLNDPDGPDPVSGHGLVDAEEATTGTQTNP